MIKEIGDEAARAFAAAFYRAIAFGYSIQDAFDLGVNAIMLEGFPEDNTPALLTMPGTDASRVFRIGETGKH
jgi:hypothetical protein